MRSPAALPAEGASADPARAAPAVARAWRRLIWDMALRSFLQRGVSCACLYPGRVPPSRSLEAELAREERASRRRPETTRRGSRAGPPRRRSGGSFQSLDQVESAEAAVDAVRVRPPIGREH